MNVFLDIHYTFIYLHTMQSKAYKTIKSTYIILIDEEILYPRILQTLACHLYLTENLNPRLWRVKNAKTSRI